MTNTVLLVLDLQQGILARLPDTTAYLERVAATTAAARAAAIPVVHVRTCFRRGHPDVSSRNLAFGRLAAYNGFVEGDDAVAFAAAVAPVDGDVVVTKRRVSALSGSDLDAVLRGLDATALVIAGVATSGAVLSTVRQAADADFRLTVLRDLCLDQDPEVHRVLVDKVFPRQARVTTSDSWLGEI